MAVPTSAASELNALERDVLTVLALTDEPWLSRTGWKELMQLGIALKRRRLRAAEPGASEEEIYARLLAWMSAPR